MATISSLTALTTAASDDVIAIDDTSASTTKKITVGNLTSVVGGDANNQSSDDGGSVIALTSLGTTYTDITTYSDSNIADETTVSTANGTVTLPSGSGTYLVMYTASAARTSGVTVDIYIRAVADGVFIQGTESYISSDGGANDAHSQSGMGILSASGGEVLKLQAKIDTGTATVNVDNISFIVLRVGY